eukprot:CAMPEP_0113646348 /NCGR_PEP_ID=MMETSP0017_2-20120614/24476_1 /TAXON_ID=2856 /ORGANISM="Cylindrotheca closterium" /LENGTH=904 /DNA_ID=CAMNT_0000558225 /DNA_START=86 /DNA_END=2796 /DNA_ORIENTATION=+ /assembly_acc=CAM_ASM_000147
MRQVASNHNTGDRSRTRLLSEPSPPDSPNRSFTDTTTPMKKPSNGRYLPQADGTVKYVSNNTPSTAPMTSPADSMGPTPPSRKSGNGKMGRLASLFSSRATVASPAASDASSGYLNWPGTQDKRGGTVAMNDDASQGHLTSVVNHAAAAASPMAKQRHDDKVHRLAKPQVLYSDPWNRNHQEETMSDFSGTSSAYFTPKKKVDRVQEFGKKKTQAASVMRLTAEALEQQDHYAPPHKAMANSVGFRGLLDKSRDVPNLMDDASSLATSMSGAASNAQPSRAPQRAPMEVQAQIPEEPEPAIEEDDSYVYTDPYKQQAGDLNVVLLGGGLTTIQTTAFDFSNRVRADDTMTNSDIDDGGFVRIPDFKQMASAGRSVKDSAYDSQSAVLFNEYTLRAKESIHRYRERTENPNKNPFNSNSGGSDTGSGSSLFSDPYKKEGFGANVAKNLDQYYIHPNEMKAVVKKFRKMSSQRAPKLSLEEYDREEDAIKAFALSEMRSRIMEKDIERGLERRGGTTVVDDSVLTPFNMAAMRVRDACIVAKAWRDGATPLDVINTSMLTRRAERSYFIPRLLNAGTNQSPDYKYAWEEVLWFDDLELSQYRCHSLGPRSMRGYEMFTIGDCQSIQLKLCNDRCNDLKRELNLGTQALIEAEDMMREEGDTPGAMSEAELTYLSAMEYVKTVSHQLVVAEKSFILVKERIEKIVARYEALLVKLDNVNDNDSIAASSVVSYQSSYVSDWTAAEEREHAQLARRAQRAELRAEVAAREAMLSKQGARGVRAQKEKELGTLRKRLADLQSETSAAISEREHSVVLARVISASKSTVSSQAKDPINKGKINDVKARFRNRSAAKQKSTDNKSVVSAGKSVTFERKTNFKKRDPEKSAMLRSVGEEMYQQLDFYERSLES